MNDMKINKGYIAIGLVIAFGLFFELAAHADEADEATFITFNAPVQIPGKVLPAGTYLFVLADHGSEQDVVQVFNSERTVLYGNFLTIATERNQSADHTAVTLAEPEAGGTPALLAWFYPGNDTGNEFVYSKQTEKELAQDSHHTVLADRTSTSNSDNSGAGN
jgi:Protein of unknown function (DUF2911)